MQGSRVEREAAYSAPCRTGGEVSMERRRRNEKNKIGQRVRWHRLLSAVNSRLSGQSVNGTREINAERSPGTTTDGNVETCVQDFSSRERILFTPKKRPGREGLGPPAKSFPTPAAEESGDACRGASRGCLGALSQAGCQCAFAPTSPHHTRGRTATGEFQSIHGIQSGTSSTPPTP